MMWMCRLCHLCERGVRCWLRKGRLGICTLEQARMGAGKACRQKAGVWSKPWCSEGGPVGPSRDLGTRQEPGRGPSCSEKGVLWPLPRSSSCNPPGPGHCRFPSTHSPEYVAVGASGEGLRRFTEDPATVFQGLAPGASSQSVASGLKTDLGPATGQSAGAF